MSDIRVRFAPSPTGYLHVGGARTALYNWLYARKKGGKFILRVEDTDQERSTEEALQMQLSDLKWLGLDYDEGVGVGGDYGPYRQSERLGIYKKHADKLLQKGQCYHCFCTEQELAAEKEAAIKAGKPPQYSGKCRNLDPSEVEKRLASGEKAVVRFKVDSSKEFTVPDIVRGNVSFPASMVGDFVLLRSDGMPVYNFCCVVDDHLMNISHVLRGEEHLSNTLRQMMIYEAFDWELPQFAHLSMILGEDKQKLSKRHGATSCNEFMKKGYLAGALLNFIALLGWSSPEGKEVLTQEELIAQFDLDRLTASPAVFDVQKFEWMNATHLRALPNEELWSDLKPFLDEYGVTYKNDTKWQSRALEVLKSSMENFMDGVGLFKLLCDKNFTLSDAGKETLSWESSKSVIKKWIELVEKVEANYLTEQQFIEVQNTIKTECEVKGKHLFMPIRVAVIGEPHGAELKLLVPLMEKSSLISRAHKCLEAI